MGIYTELETEIKKRGIYAAMALQSIIRVWPIDHEHLSDLTSEDYVIMAEEAVALGDALLRELINTPFKQDI